MTLPSEVAAPAPQIDLAFDPDLSIHPSGWTWTSATGDLLAQQIKIKKGRDDEFGIVTPSGTSFQLDNADGLWTPDDARSTHWPNLVRNTPVRVSLPGGVPYLELNGGAGNYVTTPDNAALDITGDLDLRAEVEIDWYSGSGSTSQALISKWEATGNQRSYLLVAGVSGFIFLLWSTDGTAAGAVQTTIAGLPAIPRMAIRAALDVNNGAGGWTVTFYWAPTTAGPWTTIGTKTGVGVTSVFSGTAPLRVGPPTAPTASPFAGRGYRFQVRNSVGTLVADPDFTTRPVGSSSFTDSVGRVWSFVGTAAVTDRDVRCFGQIGEITPTWPHGDISGPNATTQPGDARVDITIAGIIRRLSQGQKALRSTLFRKVTAPRDASDVHAYWPMEDGRDSTQASSPVAGVPAGIMAMPFAEDDTLAASAPLPSTSGGEGFGWDLTVPPTTPTTNWQVTWFVKIPTPETAPAFTDIMRIDTSAGTLSQWVIRVDDADFHLFAKDLDGANVLSATVPSDDRMFGTWLRVGLNLTQNGTAVDWDLDIKTIDTGVVFGDSGSLASRTLGRPGRLRTLDNAPPDGISTGHFMVTTDLAVGWLVGVETAWVNETAAHRVYRLCHEENLPVEIIGDDLVVGSFLGDPAKSAPMGPQGLKTLVDLLSECADTDMGILSEQDNRFGFTYRTRRSLYNQPVALALDAATSDIANPFEPTLDDQSLRNDITVKRDGGSEHRETTDPPPQPGDVYEETLTLNIATDDDLVDQAGFRLHLGTWPGMRYRNLTTELTVAPHQMAPWRVLRLGDRATVTNLPPQHPKPTVDVLVQGWTETISPSRWTAEMTCTPAGPWTFGVTDDDTPTITLTRLPSGGTTLAGVLTTTSTGPRTVNVVGPLWTTTAAYFPMDVEVDGEVMTLSAISGTSSPQTFTISARGVNGVVKSHLSGAAVEVALPFRVAM